MLPLQVRLIAISGAAGSGKSTLARSLELAYGYHRISFATGLKRMLYTLPFLEAEKFVDRRWKEEVNYFYGKSPRELLQSLGTEWGRKMVDTNIWVKIAGQELLAELTANGTKAFVFDDLRFENEADYIRKNNGVVVHLRREVENKVKEHSSEAGIHIGFGDQFIYNNGSVRQLEDGATVLNTLAGKRCQSVASVG